MQQMHLNSCSVFKMVGTYRILFAVLYAYKFYILSVMDVVKKSGGFDLMLEAILLELGNKLELNLIVLSTFQNTIYLVWGFKRYIEHK